MSQAPPAATPISWDATQASSTAATVNWRLAAVCPLLILTAILLFGRLGHYALWDDEANTALFGESILASGDTSAVVGKNIIAYGGGWTLTNLRERYVPPFSFYVTAASLGVFGKTALAARLPFAACGLATFAVILLWLIKDRIDGWSFALVYLAMLSNVSLLLYCRQCRYYAIIILLSVVLAYLYLHWNKSPQHFATVIAICTALLATNYMGFGAALGCIAIDWLLWGRRSNGPTWRTAVLLALVQCIITIAFLQIYNPFHTPPKPLPSSMMLKLERIWWNIRDLSVNQFWIIPLIAAAPLVWLVIKRDQWLLRGTLALLVYFAFITAVEPHGSGEFSDVRYFCGLIPLAIALEARVISTIAHRNGVMALLVGLPILCTNILSGSTWTEPISTGAAPIFTAEPTQCTLISFVRELAHPPAEPYSTAASWLNEHLGDGSSILVLPQYAMYPFMFLSPKMIYAWQLTDPPSSQFKGLPDIHFAWRNWPQYLILFGPGGRECAKSDLSRAPDWRSMYSLIHTVPVYGKDTYRPELFLRNFQDVHPDLTESEIYIYKKN